MVERWGFEVPSTKQAQRLLDGLGVEGRVLVVVDGDDAVTWRSFRNLPQVHLIEPGQLNAYDVLVADQVVFTSETLPVAEDTGPFKRSTLAARARTAEEAP